MNVQQRLPGLIVATIPSWGLPGVPGCMVNQTHFLALLSTLIILK